MLPIAVPFKLDVHAPVLIAPDFLVLRPCHDRALQAGDARLLRLLERLELEEEKFDLYLCREP